MADNKFDAEEAEMLALEFGALVMEYARENGASVPSALAAVLVVADSLKGASSVPGEAERAEEWARNNPMRKVGARGQS